MSVLTKLRQSVCSHPDTTEEWTEVRRTPGLVYDTVTHLRTLWRCEKCGKEIRRQRADVDGTEAGDSE